MQEILLVDGYNVIHAWPELKRIAEESLEEARHVLIDMMQDFQGYKGCRLIVVFDAHMIQRGRGKKRRRRRWRDITRNKQPPLYRTFCGRDSEKHTCHGGDLRLPAADHCYVPRCCAHFRPGTAGSGEALSQENWTGVSGSGEGKIQPFGRVGQPRGC